MGSQFADLRTERKKEEAEEAARQRRLAKEYAAQKRREEAREAAGEKLSPMVTRVLEDLREAYYDNTHLYSPKRSGYFSWHLSDAREASNYGETYIEGGNRVSVVLVFDGTRAVRFEVEIPGRGYYQRRLFSSRWVNASKLMCALSEKALVETIKKLWRMETEK